MRSVNGWSSGARTAAGVVSFVFGQALLLSAGCTRSDEATTPLPTRQTTIDPIKSKLEAAQQEAERRRSEAERTESEPQR